MGVTPPSGILVVGKGAREHAIAWKLRQDMPSVRLFCAPGNAGTRGVAENAPIAETDVDALLAFAMSRSIDFTIVGPEAPLAAGIVDRFQDEGLRIFGPTQGAARIESSKSYAKRLMGRAGVPTAGAEAFTDFDAARERVEQLGAPIVIKADGLAAGKGVVVADTTERAIEALREAMIERAFGMAGETVLVEEFLEGRELSVFAFVDGSRVSELIAAVDYKRVGDGGAGPNTGGMGAYSPPPPDVWNAENERQARVAIMEPIVQALAADGNPYVGSLYAGLILTSQGLKVIEFNCRLGDPEAQVVLPRIASSLYEVAAAAVDGKMRRAPLRVSPSACVGVVVASGGYPNRYRTGLKVAGNPGAREAALVFHAGTALDDAGALVTDGGRVFTLTAEGPDLPTARARAYDAARAVHFPGAFYRKDIAEHPRM